jgi:hypothetical protein
LVASSERIASWSAIVGGLVLALPILVARYPPMGDLAMQEGTIAIMRHLHDPAWVPPGLYYVVVPQADQLFCLAALALSFAVPTAVACKVLVAALVAATPPLTARLLGRLQRSRWLALVVGPIACGWMFRWGLVANLTGFVLLLFALAELERLARRPSTGTIVRATTYAGALFFAHVTSALIFAAMASLFAALHSTTWRNLLARLAPVGATAALSVAQWELSRQLLPPDLRKLGSDFGPGPIERLATLPGAVFGGMSSSRLALIGGVWVVAAAASALLGRRTSERRLPLRVGLWRHRYVLLSAAFLVLYFVFPLTIARASLLAQRFLPAACVCIVVACARRTGARVGASETPWPSYPIAIALAAATPLVMLAVEMPAFVASDADYSALDRVIALTPRDVAVAQLDLTPRGPGHVAPVPGAAGRVLAERGGRMLFAITDMTPNPLYVKLGATWDEPVRRLVGNPYAFMPAYDLTRFSYLLERNENAGARAAVARAVAPEAELVAEAGAWSLFRSRLEIVSLDAPDGLLPSPSPETLGARLNRRQARSAATVSP